MVGAIKKASVNSNGVEVEPSITTAADEDETLLNLILTKCQWIFNTPQIAKLVSFWNETFARYEKCPETVFEVTEYSVKSFSVVIYDWICEASLWYLKLLQKLYDIYVWSESC